MVYKFVSQEASGTWQWCLHRQCQGGFRSERMAAQDLAHCLRIPLKDLRADANVKGRTKPVLPEELAEYAVLWNPEKFGWYTKQRRVYYIEPPKVIKDANLKKKEPKRQKITDRPGPWRQFKGITYHCGKKAWVAQMRMDGVNRQIGGLHDTPQEAAETLAHHSGVLPEELEKGGQSYQRADELCQHFLAVMKAYATVDFPTRLPGDLTSLFGLRPESQTVTNIPQN